VETHLTGLDASWGEPAPHLAHAVFIQASPGRSGKSFTVRSVVELARAKGAKIVLAAPTGRAAKRLAELTGHEAATIHRLLALRPGSEPSFDADHPLDADLVVVDETSMVDVILAGKLLKAVAPGARLLLVGDVDQPGWGAKRGASEERYRATPGDIQRLNRSYGQFGRWFLV
jgi:exodeoxyribonuclease V alpha subunit